MISVWDKTKQKKQDEPTGLVASLLESAYSTYTSNRRADGHIFKEAPDRESGDQSSIPGSAAMFLCHPGDSHFSSFFLSLISSGNNIYLLRGELRG